MTPFPTGARLAWLWTPAGFLALLAAYVLLHLGLRVGLSPILTIDDAREAVLAQTLAWGYQPRQPPLYNWLVWAWLRLVPPGVAALTLLKYGVLAAAYSLVYATARRVVADPRLATLTAFSFLLVPPISWTYHEALTHSVAVLAACAGTAYALVRLEASGSRAAYAALGGALALGALSKFTYVVFVVALLGAALTLDRFRVRLLAPRIVLTLAVAITLLLPFGLWFVGERYDLARLYAVEVRIVDHDPYLVEAVTGILYVARFAAYYLGPLVVVFALLFPQVYRRRPPGPRARVNASVAGRLFGRFLGAVFLLLLGAALAGQLGYLKFRWMIPAFCLAPVYAFWRLEGAGYEARGLTRFAAILVAAELAVVGAILVSVYRGDSGGPPYVLNEPYDVAVEELAARGFTHGTALVGMGPLAGSVRIRFPDARVLTQEHPYYVPPAATDGQCLFVWEERRREEATAPPLGLRAMAEAALDVRLSGGEPLGHLDLPYRFAPGRSRRVHYLLFPAGVGRCR